MPVIVLMFVITQLLNFWHHVLFTNCHSYCVKCWEYSTPFRVSYLYKYLCIHGKCITCSFALWWILISEILKQINVVQWHQSLLYIFISRTYQKVCLVLTKQHVNTVACLYRYYTCNWVNIDEESHSCLCYIHCNHDYFTM